MGLCVFILPTPPVMIVNIYTLSYYHHQIRSMNYYPLFRVRSWNNGVRCMSFYILFLSMRIPIDVEIRFCLSCRQHLPNIPQRIPNLYIHNPFPHYKILIGGTVESGVVLGLYRDCVKSHCCREHFGYSLIQWEDVLLCNVFCHLDEPIPRIIPVLFT